ncbi:hypothetical protein ACFV5G_35455, partial [Streptomyces sp. NPDC059766]|uniref:hypothetical protein n=1 Tax=Streptomyces sp. NPDC059766 TaxID=3346940 RepID=UPI003659A741
TVMPPSTPPGMAAITAPNFGHRPNRIAKPAAHTAVNVPFLDTVLYLLGVTREEVEAADTHDDH